MFGVLFLIRRYVWTINMCVDICLKCTFESILQNFKMLTKCYAILFLALVSVLFIASIDAKQQYNLTIHHASTINISFKSLINGSENSVYFVCDARTFVVPPQRSHMITLITDYAVTCQVTWKVVQATITAFDPKTDLKLDSGIYWILRPDGLLKSLNNFIFDKVVDWTPRSQ
jgi:hypothetical protein